MRSRMSLAVHDASCGRPVACTRAHTPQSRTTNCEQPKQLYRNEFDPTLPILSSSHVCRYYRFLTALENAMPVGKERGGAALRFQVGTDNAIVNVAHSNASANEGRKPARRH